jgi:hypothetical protein
MSTNNRSDFIFQRNWRRDGSDWRLAGHRRRGRVVPDSTLGMWRVEWGDGERSDLTNLSRAKDALARYAESEERRRRARAEEPRRRPPVRGNSPAGIRQPGEAAP